jgi:hypothetical protein
VAARAAVARVAGDVAAGADQIGARQIGWRRIDLCQIADGSVGPERAEVAAAACLVSLWVADEEGTAGASEQE